MLADAPCLPASCRQLWADFLDLAGSRVVTSAGPARISYSDIDAWQRVNGIRFAAWEIDAIRRADSAFIEQTMKRRDDG